MYYKKMVGKRIFLSPISASDVSLFTKWMNDFSNTDYTLRSAELFNEMSETAWIESKSKENSFVFSIIKFENDEEKNIGVISIDKINYSSRSATLGIMIGDPEERSKGYGS